MPRCSGPRLLTMESETSDSSSEYDDSNDACNNYEARQLDRDIWVEENLDQLLSMYDDLLTRGRSIFGDAFLQDGNWADFAHFCYYKTQPFYFPKEV